MSPISLLMQAFFDHQTREQGERFREAGMRAAEKGRRMALAGVFFALAGAFFFSGLMVALIDLGLQIDRGNGVSYSGLMLSATLIVVFGLMSVFAGWLCGRDPVAEVALRMAPPPPPPQSELRLLLEQIAVIFLKEFMTKHSSSEPAQRTETPQS
jgi:hypothetical protein